MIDLNNIDSYLQNPHFESCVAGLCRPWTTEEDRQEIRANLITAAQSWYALYQQHPVLPEGSLVLFMSLCQNIVHDNPHLDLLYLPAFQKLLGEFTNTACAREQTKGQAATTNAQTPLKPSASQPQGVTRI